MIELVSLGVTSSFLLGRKAYGKTAEVVAEIKKRSKFKLFNTEKIIIKQILSKLKSCGADLVSQRVVPKAIEIIQQCSSSSWLNRETLQIN